METLIRKNTLIMKSWTKIFRVFLGLMPLGGEEVNSGYKGYGLGMLVDILCGVMSGSNFGPNVRHWNDYEGQIANLGHFFVALDPECFAPGFGDRLEVKIFEKC